VSTEKKRPASKTQASAAAPRARKGIQSVEVGVRVVDVLAKATEPLPLSEVGRLAGISASQAHRYLTSFGKSDLIFQDAATGRYGLGPQALRWGISAMSKTDVFEVSSQALTELCEKLDLTGIFCVWGDRGPTCVRLKRSKLMLGTDLGLGSIFPVLTSATGRVFLTHLPKTMTSELVRLENATMRRQGREIDAKQIKAICADIRRAGLAQEQGHYVNSVSALAAPVFDYQGDIVVVMTLLFRRELGMATNHQPLAEALLATTSAVSEALGWRGETRSSED